MKSWLSFFMLLTGLGRSHAQGTIEFHANIPLGTSSQYGTGTFELSGSSLSYNIVFNTLPGLISDLAIAEVGALETSPIVWGVPSVSPVLLSFGHLPNTYVENGTPTVPGVPPWLPVWTGVIENLAGTEITDLTNGRWEVVGTLGNLTFPRPTYESVSGQILPVPEPAPMCIAALGIGFLFTRFRKRLL